MTGMVRGTVLGVDRESGTVRADIDGVVVPAAPFMGDPPWPLSVCWFFNGPAYTCLGPVGGRRWCFQDDFNYYRSATPYVSTGWTDGGDAGGSLSNPADPSDGCGVLRLTTVTTGDLYFLRKTLQLVTLESDRVYWLSARVRQSADLGGMDVGFAVSNWLNLGAAAASDAASVVSLSSAENVVLTAKGTSENVVATGESSAADTWVWVDVMVAGGQWAAGWVDGSGPWVSDVEVPGTSEESVTPYIGVGSDGAGNTVDVDYCALAVVDQDTTVDPTTFGNSEDPTDTT